MNLAIGRAPPSATRNLKGQFDCLSPLTQSVFRLLYFERQIRVCSASSLDFRIGEQGKKLGGDGGKR